jgi:hypothetical protein
VLTKDPASSVLMAVNGEGGAVLQRRIVRSIRSEGQLGSPHGFCVSDASKQQVGAVLLVGTRIGGRPERQLEPSPFVTTTHPANHPPNRP